MHQLHPSTPLIPPHTEEPVEIDNDMVPLVRALWARGWQTMACCQDDGEAVAAERENGKHGEPTGQKGFIEYLPVVHQDDVFRSAPYVQICFQKDQIQELVTAL